MPGPKFGVIYSRLHQVIPPGAFARKVEDMGFDAVWATEGLANQLQALDPIVAMAALALGSERLTVGSCVIISPLRNPAILAKEVASLEGDVSSFVPEHVNAALKQRFKRGTSQ